MKLKETVEDIESWEANTARWERDGWAIGTSYWGLAEQTRTFTAEEQAALKGRYDTLKAEVQALVEALP